MERVLIGAETEVGLLRERLRVGFQPVVSAGGDVAVEEMHRAPITFFDCRIQGSPNEYCRQVFRYCVARELAQRMADDLYNTWVSRMLDHRYRFLSTDERKRILQDVQDRLDHPEDAELAAGGLAYLACRDQALQRLLDYLNDHEEVVVEGFVRFRLRDLVDEVDRTIRGAVDEYLVQREYEEFIELLRYFMERQEPAVEEAHVVVRSGGRFRVLDEQGKIVPNDYLESALSVGPSGLMDENDLLISALITLAPLRVILHLHQEADAITTVQAVFHDRAIVCPGCARCPVRRPSADRAGTHPRV